MRDRGIEAAMQAAQLRNRAQRSKRCGAAAHEFDRMHSKPVRLIASSHGQPCRHVHLEAGSLRRERHRQPMQSGNTNPR